MRVDEWSSEGLRARFTAQRVDTNAWIAESVSHSDVVSCAGGGCEFTGGTCTQPVACRCRGRNEVRHLHRYRRF